MKLNGALKPRQGASKQGRSPGVVFKEYRVKRYFEVNKNVVNGLPLYARGAKNKKSIYDNNVINSNYDSINNQQRAITSLSHQLERKEKCGEALSEGICKSLRNINSVTSIRIIKTNNFLAKGNTRQSRVPTVTKTEFCRNYLYNRRHKYRFLQKVTAAVAQAEAKAAAAAETDTAREKIIKRKTNIHIDSGPKTVVNITARQIANTKLKKESVIKKKNYTIRDAKKTKQVYNKDFEKTGHNNITNNNNNNPKQVNKFLFVPEINENSNLKAIILRLSIELQLMLFSTFLHAIRHFNGKLFSHFAGSSRDAANTCGRAIWGYRLDFRSVDYNITNMMCASQLLVGLFKSICLKNAKRAKSSVALFMVIYAVTAILLPQAVVGDDGDTFFPINGIETTTPEFDYASRGQKKFGDKCENTLECGFPGSICDPKKKSCQCTEDLPVTNHIDKCGKEAAVNESCFFNEQCEVKYFQTECRDQRCVCRFDMTPVWLKDGSVECKGRGDKKGPETYIDPAMIGVLIGMALMFIIICVVLRLFSQARWRENRTIFNTPNPRLMNVSLLRESKLLHGQERRGSRMSVRAPSRQPSMASLRPHSPNPSLGKTGSRSNSHGSNASATSLRSTRSNCVSPAGITVANNSHHERKGSTYQPHQHHHSQQQKLQTLQQEEEPNLAHTNIISNPVAETVTVEIIEPEKFTKSSE